MNKLKNLTKVVFEPGQTPTNYSLAGMGTTLQHPAQSQRPNESIDLKQELYCLKTQQRQD